VQNYFDLNKRQRLDVVFKISKGTTSNICLHLPELITLGLMFTVFKKNTDWKNLVLFLIFVLLPGVLVTALWKEYFDQMPTEGVATASATETTGIIFSDSTEFIDRLYIRYGDRKEQVLVL